MWGVPNQIGGVPNQRAIRGWSECGIVTRLPLTSDRLLVLKHPLLLSIIKIIESGLQVLLRQEASAVCSDVRKSDWLPLPIHSILLILHLTSHSSILTFVTSPSFTLIHLTSADFSHLLTLVSLLGSCPNSSHMKHSSSLTFVTQSIIYICHIHDFLHMEEKA